MSAGSCRHGVMLGNSYLEAWRVCFLVIQPLATRLRVCVPTERVHVAHD